MSETKPLSLPTQSPPLPTAASSNFDLYTKLYTQAYCLATAPYPIVDDAKGKEIINKQQQQHQKKIIITINTIAKLIFGLDKKQKTRVVLHGEGALELIMALVNQSDHDQATLVQTSALKAIKTCVLRNPAGRSRCRSAGVLTYINAVLQQSLNLDDNGNTNANASTDVTLAEEAFTTLAALSLGDDLNALEASTNVKPYIQSSKTVFADAKSMHQKTLYLETLFGAVEKEQEKLLKRIKVMTDADEQSFFKDLVDCETSIRKGFSHLQDEKYALSFEHYNHAMKLISPFVNDTDLLNDMVGEIRIKRAQAALELGKVKECLEDTSILLESKDTADKGSRALLLKMNGKALILAGKVKEGKETLAKLMIICPQNDDVEVAKLLENLKVDADE
jgi:hypothetical protein